MTSKIVPREPTQKMCAAASDYAGTLEEHAVMTYANIWRAMYDAAPAMEKPAEDASAADADEKLIEQLHGPHESGLLHRLEGAQKMHDAGKSISTWVASAIDNEAAKWIRQAADRIAELRAERDKLLRERLPYHNEIAFITAERDRVIADGELTRDYAKEQRERAMRAEAECDMLRAELKEKQ